MDSGIVWNVQGYICIGMGRLHEKGAPKAIAVLALYTVITLRALLYKWPWSLTILFPYRASQERGK